METNKTESKIIVSIWITDIVISFIIPTLGAIIMAGLAGYLTSQHLVNLLRK